MIKYKILSSLVLFFLASGISAQFEISWKQEKAMAVTFLQLPEVPVENLKVYLSGADRPIFGQWQISDNVCTFKPALAFTQGEQYQLRNGKDILSEFTIELKSGRNTKLIQIFPDRDTLPANLLKIHLQFSHPMGELLSDPFIVVMGESGDTLQKTFLPLQPELWNEKHDQLTLWLDPGRIKRDLGPHLWLGTPLHAYKQYIIHISPAWKDQKGQPLKEGFRKTFFTEKADRTKPNPTNWSLLVPLAGSRMPLQINFHESMDYLLSRECLTVEATEPIAGTINLENHQQIWSFVPEVKWKKGRYRLMIEGRLEDLAGNNLYRLFDEDVSEGSKEKVSQDLFFLTFEIL